MSRYNQFFTLIGQLELGKDRRQRDKLFFLPLFRQERKIDFEDYLTNKSDLHAVYFDENNNQFLKVPLAYSSYCTDHENSDNLIVRGYIPYDEKTAGIKFIFRDKPIGEQKVDKEKPTVKINSDLSAIHKSKSISFKWGIQYRGDNTIHSKVLYSNNDGKTWQSIESRTDSNQIQINTSHLIGGDKCCIAVKVTDGYHNAYVETERFKMPDLAPKTIIYEPLENERFDVNRSVLLNGQATNLNNQKFIDNLLWESSIDGKLGNGSLVQVKLSRGKHQIKLTAQDRTLSSAESVTIIVE